MRRLMTPARPQWREFADRLEGPEGCNFRDNSDPMKITWSCDHTQTKARRLLADYDVDAEATLKWLYAKGGHCDCEILFNVDCEK